MYPIYYISGKEYTFLLMVVGVKLFEVLCCVSHVTFLRPERYVAFLAMLLILDAHGAIVILAQVSLASRIILDLIGNLGYIAVMNSTVGMFYRFRNCLQRLHRKRKSQNWVVGIPACFNYHTLIQLG